ncbi:MAG TPA: hypothetical protein VM238_02005 [Phycisphaerae bacterium]|nr:hypothetical protein [Phycisphaerae bacterium]
MTRARAILLLASITACSGLGAATPNQPGTDGPWSEAVNGLAVSLSAAVRPDGQPKLRIRLKNVGDEPFDLVEFGPLFLEVQDAARNWKSYQHPRWRADKVKTAHTFEPAHDESESESLSAFASLPPGTYRVRVTLTLDAGMLVKYESKRLWTGVVRSNTVVVTVPPSPRGQ